MTVNGDMTVKIPEHVLSQHIFSLFEIEDINTITQVCKRWKQIVLDPKTLHAIYNNLYAIIPEKFSEKNRLPNITC